MIEFMLLFGGKVRIKHFQLHGFRNIFAMSEPENKSVTLVYALLCITCLGIKLCKLISPVLLIIKVL